jgi:L-threonylcarbamoyladenylate synthase
MEMADSLVARWPGGSRSLLSGIWPAPLTAILPARKAVPEILASRRSVALRIPAHEELRALVEALGEPLVSTSVNIVGRAPVTRIAEAQRAFPGLDAYLSRRGRATALPSTVVDFRFGEPRLIRRGVFRWPADG